MLVQGPTDFIGNSILNVNNIPYTPITLPKANVNLLGQVVYYTNSDTPGSGTTHTYKCVSAGGGTYIWTQISGSGTVTGATSIGTGTSIVAGPTGPTLTFKALAATGPIQLTNPNGATGPIIINSNALVLCEGYNIGTTGYNIYSSTTGPAYSAIYGGNVSNILFKGISEGSNISITDDISSNTLIINSTSSGSGPTGPAGATGPRGYQGYTGPQGSTLDCCDVLICLQTIGLIRLNGNRYEFSDAAVQAIREIIADTNTPPAQTQINSGC